jgi:predicted HTH transcriptional regulator
MTQLDSEAVDFRAASECFAPVRTLARRDLETLRLLTVHQSRLVPTVGGVLLFGKHRERDFPDAWIQAGRFAGEDKSRIIDHVEIHALPVRAVEEAIAFVTKHSVHGAEIGAVRRVERWSVPPAAVREAVINAVVHADYAQRGAPIRVAMFDDRLEVESPGLLPFGLTIEDLPQGVSKLRNRVIGRVFHALGLIEQWGSGIQRIPAPVTKRVSRRRCSRNWPRDSVSPSPPSVAFGLFATRPTRPSLPVSLAPPGCSPARLRERSA